MKIIHLNQVHKNRHRERDPCLDDFDNIGDIDDNTVMFKAVALSQFLVGRFILKNPLLPVVIEGLYEDIEDITTLDDESEIMRKLIHEIFPNGFPDSFNDLSPFQKLCLYLTGAPKILLYLGVINSIYKSQHKDLAFDFDSKIYRKLAKGKEVEQIDYLFINREKEAIKCSKEAASKRYGTLHGSTVILVFGCGHDFYPLCNSEGIEHELVETSRVLTTTDGQKYGLLVGNHLDKYLRPKTGAEALVPMRKFHHLMTFAPQKLDEKTIYQDTDISKDRYQQFYSS